MPPRGSPPLQTGGQNQKWPTSGHGGYMTLPPRGSPPLQSGGQKERWQTFGEGGYITAAAWGVPTASKRRGKIRSGPQVGKVAGYITPAASGVPTASEGGAKSEVAHKWARWLRNPGRLGGSPPLQSGRAKSKVAHKWARWVHNSCRLRGSHRFRAGGQNQTWPISGQGGYITPADWGVPIALERGGKIKSGPQVGKVAT